MQTPSKKETDIQKALSAYNEKKKSEANPNVAKIAKEFNVDYQRLYARIRGRSSYKERRVSNKRLDDTQEALLLEYINEFDSLMASLDAPRIQIAAQDILNCRFNEDDSTPKPLSKMWAYNFLKRHPELKQRARELKEINRGISEDPGDIRWWMGCYTNVIEAYGIQPRDIYNMDETGFRIGQGKRVEGVYTKYPQRAPSASSIDSVSQRKLVTSVECISQDGWVLPPLIIMPGEVQMRDWYELVTLPPAYIIEMSSTGYINMELAYLWLHHFHISTRSRQIGKYRLLIFDQHKSHMTRDFMRVAEALHILCLPLIPHLTHLLQPLDSIPFMQAKKAHADAVNKASWLSGINYDKVHFLSDIEEIRSKAFTPKIIAAGWRETGLYPFDIDRIMKKIGAFENQETPLQMLDGENIHWEPC
jgi:hypothetical protein